MSKKRYISDWKNKCACGKLKSRNAKICRDCFDQGLLIKYKTLGEVLQDKKYSSKVLTTVRHRARGILLNSGIEKSCKLCNNHEFDAVVEACHIKGIMSFSKETPISEINDIKNLIWLCPSHHALLDKNLVSI